MAPTETAILSNYLLIPAQFPTIISLEHFANFFPKSQRSSPQIRALYRDLQRQRNRQVDAVSASIEGEAQLGKVIRRDVLRANKEAGADEADKEDEVEKALFGLSSREAGSRHTLSSIIVDMEAAADDLEGQIQDLEAEEARLLQSVQQTVGDLSDLRYGRLANPKLPEQVLEGLQTLQDICEKKT